MELMRLTLEYSPTPKVAAKKPRALARMEGREVSKAMVTASCLLRPAARSPLIPGGHQNGIIHSRAPS